MNADAKVGSKALVKRVEKAFHSANHFNNVPMRCPIKERLRMLLTTRQARGVRPTFRV